MPNVGKVFYFKNHMNLASWLGAHIILQYQVNRKITSIFHYDGSPWLLRIWNVIYIKFSTQWNNFFLWVCLFHMILKTHKWSSKDPKIDTKLPYWTQLFDLPKLKWTFSQRSALHKGPFQYDVISISTILLPPPTQVIMSSLNW